jgi:hypothetical protein
MKKLFSAAFALVAMTGIASADGVVLSDANLDRVTAGVDFCVGSFCVPLPPGVIFPPPVVPAGNVKTVTAPGTTGVASCVGTGCSVKATFSGGILSLCSASGGGCANGNT